MRGADTGYPSAVCANHTKTIKEFKMPKRRKSNAKRRKHRSFRTIFVTTLICAAAALATIVMIAYFIGLRYVSLVTADGNHVKFFGWVDPDDGTPVRGKIVYSIGLIATVDRDSDTVTYSDGSSYSGGMEGLLKSGYGRMDYGNGDIYEGEWMGDLMNGAGKYTYNNGDIYEGNFKNSNNEGRGVYKWHNGSVYEGFFSDGLRHGEGTMKSCVNAQMESFDVYVGWYDKDKKSGSGKYTWANGDVYEGSYKDDVCSGHGVMRWANGQVYEGDFANNTLNGKGKYSWPTGRIYEGIFEDGLIIRVEYDNGVGDEPDMSGSPSGSLPANTPADTVAS